MTALRLTLRFVICVLVTPIVAVFIVASLVEWCISTPGDIAIFHNFVKPWFARLIHPLKEYP